MKIEISGMFAEPGAKGVEAFAVSYLTADDGERGMVEMADRKAERVCAAFGRLLEILAEKGMLSAPEVARIVLPGASLLPQAYDDATCVFRKE